MNCCEKCFDDIEIRAIIRSKKTKGNCDICGSRQVFVYDMDSNYELKENFDELIGMYSPLNERPTDYPLEQTDLIKNILHNKWKIFSLSAEQIYVFLTKLLPDKYDEEPELFDHPVGIFESINKNYQEKYSILGEYQWEDFVKEIKENNRFHTNIVNKELLSSVLQATFKPYKKGLVFYRARICKDSKGFKPKEMGSPPSEVATAGRANPEGISCLYLADSVETVLREVRAGVYDYVTVGKFNPRRI